MASMIIKIPMLFKWSYLVFIGIYLIAAYGTNADAKEGLGDTEAGILIQVFDGYLKVSRQFYFSSRFTGDGYSSLVAFLNPDIDFVGQLIVGRGGHKKLTEVVERISRIEEYQTRRSYNYHSYLITEYTKVKEVEGAAEFQNLLSISRGSEFILLHGKFSNDFWKRLLSTYTTKDLDKFN